MIIMDIIHIWRWKSFSAIKKKLALPVKPGLSGTFLSDYLELEELIYTCVYCHSNFAPPTPELMQSEMSWLSARCGVNQHCQSATSQQEGGGGPGEHLRMQEQRWDEVFGVSAHVCNRHTDSKGLQHI